MVAWLKESPFRHPPPTKTATQIFSPTHRQRHIAFPKKSPTTPQAFHINHKHHLELAWQRQQAREEQLAHVESAVKHNTEIINVTDLQYLERILSIAGGRICLLYLYSSSCGVCKSLNAIVEDICKDSHNQKAGIVFLKHNVMNEYDYPSDLARFYSVKSTPRFLFFIDGALQKSIGMNDVRQFRATRGQIGEVLDSNEQRLRSTLWELLVKNAPSARR